ncbi:uncharacterized protein LOC127265513 [Andrographis paniculata]|uniref:uncharacterized protein LOC127265513 n=1 Tax=Andrographis paniculata TaxID=175694 RepID=UPI0021E789B4|nr:uncharacterized protein LOC127265513 [Andrographis paniculata]
MADKPSRALVLYGDGLSRSVASHHTHLHSFASRASCGFLALPNSSPSEDEEARVIREFAELMDSNGLDYNTDLEGLVKDKHEEKCAIPSVSERFMGMKAAMITDSFSLKSFGSKLGFSVLSWNESSDKTHSPAEIPRLVPELLKLLGFQEGKILDNHQFDLLVVHVRAGEILNDLKDIEFVNQFVGALLQREQFIDDIRARLHLSVVTSHGAELEDDHLQYSISDMQRNNNSELSVLFPRQSYTIKGGKPRENIRHHCPMLSAQYQEAVTRKDMVKSFSFKDILENGGSVAIPADRFLHEVAFKLWKAPKYGA